MMSDKSVLVIDTPKDCIECPLFAFECCHVRRKEIPMENITQGIKPEWCPLRPLPSQMKYNDDLWTNNAEEEYYKEGWNRFYEMITGETE